jgi:hypothetical protein
MANTQRLLDASGRTPEEAMANILNRTKKENIAKAVILADLRARFPTKKWAISDGGCDNSGAYIDNPYNVSLAPDWNLHSDNTETQCEVLVHSEKYSTCSFKVVKLKYSVEHESITIVVRDNQYYCLGWAGAAYLLDTFEHESVARINGGKPSIILSNSDINILAKEGYIKVFKYNGAALDAVAPLRKDLFV